MSARVARRSVALLIAALLLIAVAASAGNARFWARYASAVLHGAAQATPDDYRPTELLRGGDGGGLPRANAGEEGVDAEALQAAATWSREQDADALLVLHRGHLVQEQYLRGDAGTLLDGGALARLLRSAATGAAIQQGLLDPPAALRAWQAADATTAHARGRWWNPWSPAAQLRFGAAPTPEYLRDATHQRYAQFVSRALWAPLNAGDAALWLDPTTDTVRTACCVLARPLDWLRLAQLLLDAGRLDGESVLADAWLARLFVSQAGGPDFGLLHAKSAHGPEPFATSGVWFARGTGATRLWLAPRLQLAILLVAPRGKLDDTSLPNLILRGTHRPQSEADRADQPRLDSLVPAH